jgi:hypothetical protein
VECLVRTNGTTVARDPHPATTAPGDVPATDNDVECLVRTNGTTVARDPHPATTAPGDVPAMNNDVECLIRTNVLNKQGGRT